MGAVYLVRHGQAGTHVSDYDQLSDRGRPGLDLWAVRMTPGSRWGRPSSTARVTVLAEGIRGVRLVAFNEHAHLLSGDADVGTDLLTYH